MLKSIEIVTNQRLFYIRKLFIIYISDEFCHRTAIVVLSLCVRKMSAFTCISCRVAFADGDIQRAHYKSDWHRYNLKRKVADMPPVTAESFREKVLIAQKAENDSQAQEKNSKHCEICNKLFSSANAFSNHLQSKKHKEQEAKCAADKQSEEKGEEKRSRNRKKSNNSASISEEDSGDEYEEIDDECLETTQCLFCPHFSTNFEDNMRHMTKSHSFFIPDVQYITDLEGLVCYLGGKVGLGKLCLYCNNKGKAFYSIEAVQKHMIDKGHCKMFYEDDAVLEFSDFYDFSSSYPDGGKDNEDVEVGQHDGVLTVSEGTGELCLPSGAKVGHRSLKHYYRQNLQPKQVKRNEVVVRGLLADYKSLGWSGTIGEAHRLKVQNLKMKKKFQSKRELKLGVKGNKLQTHFREQVIF